MVETQAASAHVEPRAHEMYDALVDASMKWTGFDLGYRRAALATRRGGARFLLAVVFVFGCAPQEPLEGQGSRREMPDPDESEDKDCSGEHSWNGCDDCNPCSWDAWCDPDDWNDWIPEWCRDVATLGHAACVHVDRTTPDGQINDCFPIAPVTDVRAGKCCAGTCVDNSSACEAGPVSH